MKESYIVHACHIRQCHDVEIYSSKRSSGNASDCQKFLSKVNDLANHNRS